MKKIQEWLRPTMLTANQYTYLIQKYLNILSGNNDKKLKKDVALVTRSVNNYL